MPSFFVLPKTQHRMVSFLIKIYQNLPKRNYMSFFIFFSYIYLSIYLSISLSLSLLDLCVELHHASPISQSSSQQLGPRRSHSTPPPSPLGCPVETTHRHRGRRTAAASSSPVLRRRGGRRWAWSPSLSETCDLLPWWGLRCSWGDKKW